MHLTKSQQSRMCRWKTKQHDSCHFRQCKYLIIELLVKRSVVEIFKKKKRVLLFIVNYSFPVKKKIKYK